MREQRLAANLQLYNTLTAVIIGDASDNRR
jgi:hypothetical protein